MITVERFDAFNSDSIHRQCSLYVRTIIHLLSQEGKSALLRAAETGNIDAVIRELSGHTDVNSQDEVNVLITLELYYALCN